MRHKFYTSGTADFLKFRGKVLIHWEDCFCCCFCFFVDLFENSVAKGEIVPSNQSIYLSRSVHMYFAVYLVNLIS